MFSGVMPPTGNIGNSFGRTARNDFNTFGGLASAGNSLIASAPALIIRNASVGVAKPGTTKRLRRLAASMTRSSACGITMSLPPASATFVTCSQSVTVPAPTSALSPRRLARRTILA